MEGFGGLIGVLLLLGCGAYLLFGLFGVAAILAGLHRIVRSYLPERVIRLIGPASWVPYASSVRQKDRDDGISYIVVGGIILGIFFLIDYLVIAPIIIDAID
jgi:hypothetical protein